MNAPSGLLQRQPPAPSRGARPGARRGYSLVEALVYCACLSVILSTVAVSLQTMFKLPTAARTERETAAAWDDLADDLRRDAAWATAARQEGEMLQFTLADGGEQARVVRYQPAPGGVRREEGRGETLLRREFYQLARPHELPRLLVDGSRVTCELPQRLPVARITTHVGRLRRLRLEVVEVPP